jgi:hypothetical protein
MDITRVAAMLLFYTSKSNPLIKVSYFSKIPRHTKPRTLRSIALMFLAPQKFVPRLRGGQWHDIHADFRENRPVTNYNIDVCS